MKHIYILFLLISSIGLAQIPSDYYDSADGLSGFALKSELKSIITNGHNDQGYDGLYTGYATVFIDNIEESGYENDGTLLMYYTENPNGTDPYTFTLGTNQCGNYNSESDCYNREHLVPQSSFGSASPMKNDIHHVVPSDGYANGKRNNFPFGTVSSATWTSLNGSQLGSSNVTGYSGTVFEPIDEFKGDIARAILYFVTRYENNVDGYSSFEMFNGTENQALEDWAIDMLLDWHYNIDPVDQYERDRNDAAFNFQGNANPFVDHPEYANMIWNPTPDTEAPSTPTNLVASNPTNSTIDLSWDASTDNIGVTIYDIYMDGNYAFSANNTSATKTNLIPGVNFCFTVVAKDASGNESDPSNESCETTTNNGDNPDPNCIDENFENIGTSSGSYSSVTWTGNEGLTWNATDARTDQTLDSRAITIRNGILGPTDFSNISFIDKLTVTTQRVFGGGSGNFDLVVNGNVVGTIPYGDDPETTTIMVNVNPVTSLVINNNSTPSNRVMFDNLSWTCGLLSTPEYNLEHITLHPNPVKNELTIGLKSNITTNIEIFDILGKRVLRQRISKTSGINVTDLRTGIYIVKMTQGDSTITKKLIKQ
ncbi:endonuclease [Winogradskyella sediminis]|uniref:endonuclease n=1 Tax=Winogradskyella sediminis TaxID=1382466 RepID=UPI000E25DB35|nr:endonuclease [Winogradskyella sediminis]REG87318.1 putative secreted protein (Por secretion system target) [Winogradskyella sediminis]